MQTQNPIDVVLAFVDTINRHDVKALVDIMSEDYTFIDSEGSVIKGREDMRKGWIAYFTLIPDYQISISETMQTPNAVGIFGLARGTYAVQGKLLEENKWEMPAAWRAVVKENKISEWQVYADNEPVRQIMAAQK
jgi:ketosteroid isomerase-like protein